jgi:hypothetical protein
MPDLNFNPDDPKDKDYTLYVAEFEIEKEDVFHLKNLYKMIHDWMMLHEFYPATTGELKKDERLETMYLQRILQNGNLEHSIWWRCEHTPRNSKFYKFFLRLDFITLNMGTKEVTVKGQKQKTNSGDIIIRGKAFLMLDYQMQWRKDPFLKHPFIHRWFFRHIYAKQIDFLKTDLWVTTYKLHDVIKQYLEMKTPYELPKPFHPPGGL